MAETSLSSLRNNLPVEQTAQVAEVKVGLDTKAGFELLQRQAKMFASSSLVPDTFRGNDANCIIALNMANRLGADPMSCFQQLYVVHGKPSWSAAFLIATFNKSGKYSPIRYEFVGNQGQSEWGCRAVTTDLATGERIEGPLITMGMATAEGWATKSGSKWRTMPELMLRYRAATFLIRTTAPEISMGLQTAEEIEDTFTMRRAPDGSYEVENPSPKVTTAELRREENIVEAVVEVETEPAPKPKRKATAPKPVEVPAEEQAPQADTVPPFPSGEVDGEPEQYKMI